MQSYGIALYSYFQKRRSQAVSLNMTITGLGPVFMPPLHSLLLSRYGAQVHHSIETKKMLHPTLLSVCERPT